MLATIFVFSRWRWRRFLGGSRSLRRVDCSLSSLGYPVSPAHVLLQSRITAQGLDPFSSTCRNERSCLSRGRATLENYIYITDALGATSEIPLREREFTARFQQACLSISTTRRGSVLRREDGFISRLVDAIELFMSLSCDT